MKGTIKTDPKSTGKVPIANRASCKSGRFSFSLLCVSKKLKFLEVLDLIHTALGKLENRKFVEVKNSNLRWTIIPRLDLGDFRTEIVCRNPIFEFSLSSLGLLK